MCMRLSAFFDHFFTECRYAWRMIRKTPGATAVAVLSLALGIGANTAIFTLVNTVLLKLLPVAEPEQLYLVGTHPQNVRVSWNCPDYCAMRDRNTAFTSLAGYSLGMQMIGVQTGAGEESAELAHGIVIRTSGSAPDLASALRREIGALDPVIPLLGMRTLQFDLDQNILVERLVAALSGFFGALALLLSAVGLYGVVAYAVTRRTREIGIRMALGAERRSVLWLVFRDAGKMVLLGAVIGLGAAFGATRLVQSFLYGVDAQDPVSAVRAVAILLGAAAAASLLPARRATKVDPMVALRYE